MKETRRGRRRPRYRTDTSQHGRAEIEGSRMQYCTFTTNCSSRLTQGLGDEQFRSKGHGPTRRGEHRIATVLEERKSKNGIRRLYGNRCLHLSRVLWAGEP